MVSTKRCAKQMIIYANCRLIHILYDRCGKGWDRLFLGATPKLDSKLNLILMAIIDSMYVYSFMYMYLNSHYQSVMRRIIGAFCWTSKINGCVLYTLVTYYAAIFCFVFCFGVFFSLWKLVTKNRFASYDKTSSHNLDSRDLWTVLNRQ